MELTVLLTELVALQGSDLHLVVGRPPTFRIDGALAPQTQYAPLDAAGMTALLEPHLDDRQRAALESNRDAERTLRVDTSRFRFHVFRERGNLAACIRVVPQQVPTLDFIGQGRDTYPVFQQVIRQPRGLVLIVGPTGSGKQTTAAAMIEEINRSIPARILTVEDPIEYEFESKQALISQRGIGEDAAEFPAALRSMMQEDPDVILISEQRNLESILLTLTLAETGHLVFTTLGVNTASEAITRLIDIFPEGQQAVIRRMVAQNLVAVVAQRLVPRSDRPGRVAVNEVLIGTHRVRQMIVDGHRDLTVAIEAGRGEGMQTLDDCLVRLHSQGIISAQTAWLHLTDKERLPQGIGSGLPDVV